MGDNLERTHPTKTPILLPHPDPRSEILRITAGGSRAAESGIWWPDQTPGLTPIRIDGSGDSERSWRPLRAGFWGSPGVLVMILCAGSDSGAIDSR